LQTSIQSVDREGADKVDLCVQPFVHETVVHCSILSATGPNVLTCIVAI